MPTWLRRLAFSFVTLPSAQVDAFSSRFANDTGSPFSPGTMHTTGAGTVSVMNSGPA